MSGGRPAHRPRPTGPWPGTRPPRAVGPLICAVLAVATLAAHAATAGCPVSLRPDANTAMVQRLLDRVDGPQRICLQAGVYKGAHLRVRRSVRLEAVGTGPVILDAAGSGRPITVSGRGVQAELVGLTLTHGDADVGGGLAVEAGASARLVDCVLRANRGRGRGGAIHVADGTVSLVRARLHDNRGSRGAAIHVDGRGRLEASTTLLADNGADTAGDGAIQVGPGGTLTLRSTTVVQPQGAAILLSAGGPKGATVVTIDSSLLVGGGRAIVCDRHSAAGVSVRRSVVVGRVGFVALDLASRRTAPRFATGGAERYRPAPGSPAAALGRCDHRDTFADLSGRRRPRRCAAGAFALSR